MIHHDANLFQIAAHSACGQKRKFSGKPYYTHPQAVMEILMHHHPAATDVQLAAALLHDVIEDTKVTYDDIVTHFGSAVAEIVRGLTNVKHGPGSGNAAARRARQKRMDAQRLSSFPWEVKLIKLCDRLHNLPDIIANDPTHARVYVPETRYLLDTALTGVHDVLWNKLDTIIKNYYAETQKAA